MARIAESSEPWSTAEEELYGEFIARYHARDYSYGQVVLDMNAAARVRGLQTRVFSRTNLRSHRCYLRKQEDKLREELDGASEVAKVSDSEERGDRDSKQEVAVAIEHPVREKTSLPMRPKCGAMSSQRLSNSSQWPSSEMGNSAALGHCQNATDKGKTPKQYDDVERQ